MSFRLNNNLCIGVAKPDGGRVHYTERIVTRIVLSEPVTLIPGRIMRFEVGICEICYDYMNPPDDEDKEDSTVTEVDPPKEIG